MGRTSSLVAGGLMVLAATALLPLALAQNHTAHHGHNGQTKNQPAPSGMMGGMGQMKMSEPMMMHCRMMMNMEVKSNDPAALLALKDQLKLSDEQANRLKSIVAQARQQADQVLTDEQKKQLEPMANMPNTMMAMHQQMMEKMRQSQGEAKPGMEQMPMCPMMEMMRETNQGTQQHQGHNHH